MVNIMPQINRLQIPVETHFLLRKTSRNNIFLLLIRKGKTKYLNCQPGERGQAAFDFFKLYKAKIATFHPAVPSKVAMCHICNTSSFQALGSLYKG